MLEGPETFVIGNDSVKRCYIHGENKFVLVEETKVTKNFNFFWWELVWAYYDEGRFKKAFRISRNTFSLILRSIWLDVERDFVTEQPVSAKCRLAICLYGLDRGDYRYTIAELFGLGVMTVHKIIEEVYEAIIRNLWKPLVQAKFSNHQREYYGENGEYDSVLAIPCCWGAIDGCHIPIQCPPGGLKSYKEYHNFKNFYSIVLMTIVDIQDRFIWACRFSRKFTRLHHFPVHWFVAQHYWKEHRTINFSSQWRYQGLPDHFGWFCFPIQSVVN